ncbi:MAG: glycoside hydrolase family 32 protein [Acidobacteriota bacterium]|nr:glycoside hydrolase family 32 protein [Acidobacteriota bacterium]
MPNRSWEVGFHLRSPRNWLNDPNGLCQFRGRYYVFYQYDHDWPTVDQKAWGLFSSPDLVHWRYEGVPIQPSIPEDRHGVFSGSAFVERGTGPSGEDVLRLYYTGNVVDPVPGHSPKDFDYVYAGREQNTITCVATSDPDGPPGALRLGPKQVLLRNADYPAYCSCHVRDPKVWEQDGRRRMLLGGRHEDTRGLCLLYDSEDGISWTFDHAIESEYPFGFVWECPNVVSLDGREYLAISPQGLPRLRDRWFNRWTPGYFELPEGQRLIDTDTIDERGFVQWDFGHDFYAPQTFVDDADRTILVGWMGTFDDHYTSVPDGLAWWHCTTVPRLLSRRPDGRILQVPVPELEGLRGDGRALSGETIVAGRMADIVLTGIEGEGALTLDGSFQVFYEHGRLGVRYLDEASSAGRTSRSIPLDGLDDLRVLVDGSVVEIFANGGAETFASRWFCPEAADLRVACTLSATGTVYPMADTMAQMYATAEAPVLDLPGWNETITR